MPSSIKVVKVFIGSPGGLDTERQAAQRIVSEVNRSHSEHWGCQLKLVGWEETLPGYRRAQSLINQDLDKCEYFVGVLWNHWGSRPDDDESGYTSGFEEEFERARSRIDNGTMKDIALFFRVIPQAQLNDRGPSVTKVIEFKERCVREHKPLFKSFDNPIEFESLFRATIEEIGWREFEISSPPAENSPNPESSTNELRQQSTTVVPAAYLIDQGAANFIEGLIKRPSDEEATDACDVARFRLIAASTTRTGNDAVRLGAHDANLLFEKRSEIEFTSQELISLIETGVSGFSYHNVPLWFWVSRSRPGLTGLDWIKLLTLFGEPREKANAILILQMIGQDTPDPIGRFDRGSVLRMWLTVEGDEPFDAALAFLTTNGSSADLEFLTNLYEQVDERRRSKIVPCLVSLVSKSNVVRAFYLLTQYNPQAMPEEVVNRLFANVDSISNKSLEACLTLKADSVRRAAAVTLNSRQSMKNIDAQKLMTDSDPEVRLVAVKTLIRYGANLPEVVIRTALIQRRSGLGLLGLGTTEDTTYYDRYRESRLSELSFDDLQQAAEGCGVFDYLELIEFYRRFTHRTLKEIHANLSDGFTKYFQQKIDKLAREMGADAKVVSDTRSLEEFVRKRLTTKTLDTLSSYKSTSELPIVRRTIDEQQLYFCPQALSYLARFGDWSDKDRILSFVNKSEEGYSFLSIRNNVVAKAIASSLYAVGRERINELLSIVIDSNVKRVLVNELTQRDIRLADEGRFIRLLSDPDERVRRIVALKCSQSLNKSRVKRLLNSYLQLNEQRFYNSVHWLDLGASMPRTTVEKATKFELDSRI